MIHSFGSEDSRPRNRDWVFRWDMGRSPWWRRRLRLWPLALIPSFHLLPHLQNHIYQIWWHEIHKDTQLWIYRNNMYTLWMRIRIHQNSITIWYTIHQAIQVAHSAPRTVMLRSQNINFSMYHISCPNQIILRPRRNEWVCIEVMVKWIIFQ